ncbi:unnamed protein product [Brassica napus]|uniref:(rape) hypothetical protein n=1 Tax=Brassica napus TaxID=3708 RepID=A0A816P922_BRANA|nr:unnamed protein product [Brassica napus]
MGSTPSELEKDQLKKKLIAYDDFPRKFPSSLELS